MGGFFFNVIYSYKRILFGYNIQYIFNIRSEVLIHAAGSIVMVCIAIECIINIIISERSQFNTRPYIIWFYLYEISRVVKSAEMESRLVVA